MYEALLVIVPVVALWDYGRRRLIAHVLRHDKLLQQLVTSTALIERQQAVLTGLHEAIATNAEYTRAVLAGFVNSATDIISVSEEEKRQLKNRMAARAFDPRRST